MNTWYVRPGKISVSKDVTMKKSRKRKTAQHCYGDASSSFLGCCDARFCFLSTRARCCCCCCCCNSSTGSLLPFFDGNVRLRTTPGDSNAGDPREVRGASLTGVSEAASLFALSSISSCVRRRVIVFGLSTSFHPPDIGESPPSSELGCKRISSADEFTGERGVGLTCCGGGGISSMNQSCWAIRNSSTFWLRSCSRGDIS